MRQRTLLTLWFFVASSTIAFVQEDTRPTIPELVTRLTPGPLVQRRMRELLPKPFEELLPDADLVVVGRVEKEQTYLSLTKKDLYTDYTMTPLGIIALRPQSQILDSASPITVKRWGGRTMIDGVSVTMEDSDFRFFEPGDQIVLALTFDKVDGKYLVCGGGSGAFSLQGGRLQPLMNHERYERFRGMPLAQFVTEVSQSKRFNLP